jgi:hypothetical protein
MEKQTMHYSECKFRHRYIILPGKEKHFKKLIERKEKQFIPDDVSYFNDLFLNPSKLKTKLLKNIFQATRLNLLFSSNFV